MSAPLYAQVAVLAQLGRAGGLYTYGLPPHLAEQVQPGSLVHVPFSSRQLPGVVYALAETTDLPSVRDIVALLDPCPVLTPHQLRLARWIADYYAAPLSDVIGSMLPPGLGRKTEYVLEPGDDAAAKHLTAEQQAVLEAVTGAGRITLEALAKVLPDLDVERAVRLLVACGLLRKRAELSPPRVRERTVRLAQVTPEGRAVIERGERLRAPRQQQVLEHVLLYGPLDTAQVGRAVQGGGAALRVLERRGLVQIERQVEHRSPLARRELVTTQPMRLSSAQQAALDRIVRALRSEQHQIFLLHGVTGSGKTEVYLQAIAETVAQGRQAIVMVPEISLTPQAIERVAGRFPGRVAVLHSKLSAGERLDEWQRIRRGEVDVVVGPRSALFAPLSHPGLLVVDEEHDPSYKQDASPRYHARDAAAVLGRIAGATVLFGSATPDVATYHAARTGRIHLLELPGRPVWEGEGQREMPPVEVVDLRQELKQGNRGIFSEQLLSALDETLERREQALLFLNRRGTATVVMCRDCGYVARCPHCDIPLTYHANATRLVCHRCDRRVISPRTCPACHSVRIRYLGIGTQRVEEEVTRLFPQARVLRWDRDVVGPKDAHDDIVHRFAAHEADVLVGTQMIAKGLDFPLVTLVGVISADTGLHMPDFRAPERAFQLLTQVAGRAGRASLPSRVIVQTYTPEHYAIQAAREHDYHRFFADEMQFRESALYPPFGRLIRFVYSAEDVADCQQRAQDLRQILEAGIAAEGLPGAEVIGPAPCFVARAKKRYFWHLLVRGRGSLHALIDYVPGGWTVDVDPVDLL